MTIGRAARASAVDTVTGQTDGASPRPAEGVQPAGTGGDRAAPGQPAGTAGHGNNGAAPPWPVTDPRWSRQRRLTLWWHRVSLILGWVQAGLGLWWRPALVWPATRRLGPAATGVTARAVSGAAPAGPAGPATPSWPDWAGLTVWRHRVSAILRRLWAGLARWWRGPGLVWPRLPAWLELATIGAGYGGYDLVKLAVRAGRPTAFAHAADMWRFEQWLHINIEPVLNNFVSSHLPLAMASGYYYGLLHFIVTPLVLAWIYFRRPDAFPRLRSALVLATAGANIVFWTWPLAPPRLAVPSMVDILVDHHILGAASPHGVTGYVDLYAAMPSLHVAWAFWCAFAVVATTRTRWRQLAWLYPAATTLVVLGSANHFVLDAVGGVAIMALGLLVVRALHTPWLGGMATRARQTVVPEAITPQTTAGTGPPAGAGLLPGVSARRSAGSGAGDPATRTQPAVPATAYRADRGCAPAGCHCAKCRFRRRARAVWTHALVRHAVSALRTAGLPRAARICHR